MYMNMKETSICFYEHEGLLRIALVKSDNDVSKLSDAEKLLYSDIGIALYENSEKTYEEWNCDNVSVFWHINNIVKELQEWSHSLRPFDATFEGKYWKYVAPGSDKKEVDADFKNWDQQSASEAAYDANTEGPAI